MEEATKIKIREKIAEISHAIQELPCVVIVHNVQNEFHVEFMSQLGVEMLGITQEELISLGSEYYERYFNPEESREHNEKVLELLSKSDGEQIFSFFQQVKVKSSQTWKWFMTTLKIFMFDDENRPLLIVTTAFPIDPEHQITTKVARLLEENNFLRKNNHNFCKLSKREKEVLTLMVCGNGSQEIAEQLFISVNTVKTHRKKILQKLEVKNAFDLNKYARAFDLI